MSFLTDLLILLLTFAVGSAIRRYFILTSGEKKTNIPFIKSFNFLKGSNEIVFVNDKVLAVNAEDKHKVLGDTFGFFFGQNMQFISRDPELIYKICVQEFTKHSNRYDINSLSPAMKASLLEARDREWQTSRRAVGSVLKASKLKIDNVETDIDSTINKMLASIDRRLAQAKAKGSDTVLDVYQINKNFVMQSILKIIYNTEKMVDFDSDYNEVVEELYKFINVNYEYIARLCFLIPTLAHLIRPLLRFFDHGKYLGLLTTKLEKILGKTAKSGLKEQDASRLTTIHSLINSYRSGELSKQQLMGNAVFLMVAGFATSVDTMSALLWELAKHPDVQEKLRDDLLQYGEKSELLQQCLNETLRLYPGSLTNRDLGEDVYYKDFRLVKGASFNINIYSVHRDPKYWGNDADQWKPDRFEKNKTKNFHPAQFIPFGIGPRNCVGYNLARLELEKFTTQFVLKYKFEVCDLTRDKIKLLPLGALPYALPVEGPIHLKLTKVIG